MVRAPAPTSWRMISSVFAAPTVAVAVGSSTGESRTSLPAGLITNSVFGPIFSEPACSRSRNPALLAVRSAATSASVGCATREVPVTASSSSAERAVTKAKSTLSVSGISLRAPGYSSGVEGTSGPVPIPSASISTHTCPRRPVAGSMLVTRKPVLPSSPAPGAATSDGNASATKS